MVRDAGDFRWKTSFRLPTDAVPPDVPAPLVLMILGKVTRARTMESWTPIVDIEPPPLYRRISTILRLQFSTLTGEEQPVVQCCLSSLAVVVALADRSTSTTSILFVPPLPLLRAFGSF